MKRVIYVLMAVLIIGLSSVGCIVDDKSLQSRTDQIKSIQDNQEVILKTMDIYQKQINNKIDAIMSQQREIVNYQRTQHDYTQMLISEIRKSNQPNSNIIKIDISIDRGGYGEVSSFNNIDDAVKFINTFR